MKNKYTKNTKEIRNYLESKGFIGMSFFQNEEFIYAFLTTRANKHKQWKEKDYGTFNQNRIESYDFLNQVEATEFEFKEHINLLCKEYESNK